MKNVEQGAPIVESRINKEDGWLLDMIYIEQAVYLLFIMSFSKPTPAGGVNHVLYSWK